MSVYEDSYKSLLQGVSQQVARERLDGQVTALENMLSDPVTNLRRRPGAMFAYALDMAGATADSVLAWDTDLAGTKCHVVLNTVDGVVRLLSASYELLATLDASAYLTTDDVNNIQVATVGDEFFLVNIAQVPVLGASDTAATPDKRGFFYVKTGAFSKTYDVRVQTALGGYTATYTTPNGTSPGDAALANPNNIAAELVTLINANTGTTGVTATADASYVYVSTTSTGLATSTTSGLTYMVASGQSYIRQESDLPSRLPSGADGYIVSTGEYKALRYYKYVHAKLAWLECGDYTSPLTITNVPVSIAKVAGDWTLLTNTFEGRFAGDADSNPNPAFLTRGITGVGNYQGRLVLLSGSLVNMSASSKPRRFYRSTVTSLLDSDMISVGASAASSAAWRYAVPFGKDLLLFSEKYQAITPGANVAITPRTASVVVMSEFASDMTSKPTPIGRTVMYAAPRSVDYFGMLEMMQSTSAEAQYTSYDTTAHIPQYMAGRCRFGVSSSVANMALFSPTNDRKALIVNEYTWQGDSKVQQAWHRWSFRYDVAAAYFSGQTIHVLFVNNGVLVACTIDPRTGSVNSDSEHNPKLDFAVFVDVVDREVPIPTWLTTFDPEALGDLKLSRALGALAGEPVGATVVADVLTTVRSFPTGRVALGFPYTSMVSPSAPMRKDDNGVKISSNKMTIVRFMLGVNDSAQYDVAVSDAVMDEAQETAVGTMYFSSSDLELGQSLASAESVAIIPARTRASSTVLEISTSGTGELNIVSLEFVAKYHERVGRLRKGR